MASCSTTYHTTNIRRSHKPQLSVRCTHKKKNLLALESQSETIASSTPGTHGPTQYTWKFSSSWLIASSPKGMPNPGYMVLKILPRYPAWPPGVHQYQACWSSPRIFRLIWSHQVRRNGWIYFESCKWCLWSTPIRQASQLPNLCPSQKGRLIWDFHNPHFLAPQVDIHHVLPNFGQLQNRIHRKITCRSPHFDFPEIPRYHGGMGRRKVFLHQSCRIIFSTVRP